MNVSKREWCAIQCSTRRIKIWKICATACNKHRKNYSTLVFIFLFTQKTIPSSIKLSLKLNQFSNQSSCTSSQHSSNKNKATKAFFQLPPTCFRCIQNLIHRRFQACFRLFHSI